MLVIMRTTLAIDDELLAAAKRRALERGVTMGSVVEEALRRELARQPSTGGAPQVPVFTRGTGHLPGVELGSNRALQEILDDGLDLGRLR